MHVRIATAPGSWGVETAGNPANPPWRAVLSEIAGLGFAGTELGPLGYLPERPEALAAELGERGLHLAAGFVMEPFHQSAQTERLLAVARRTCTVLREVGAVDVVLIQALSAERARCAGRSAEATRLDDARWSDMVSAIERTAQVAADHGLHASFHPHAGTYVEFADEIARLMDDLDDGLGLCVDTGHCAYAGIDPADLLRRHGHRVRHLHLKDLRGEVVREGRAFQDAVAAGVFCPLDAGDVDLRAVRDALADLEYDGWATVEQDRLAGDGLAKMDAAASLAHLRRIGLLSSADGERIAT
jgi:inosose dehydratase